MTNITLYYTPLTCARVTFTALEETGHPYDIELVNWLDEENWKNYLAINPHGKVPALRIDDNILTENAAILLHLNEYFPKANLLPTVSEKFGKNDIIQDIIWCSSTIHPITRMIRMPMRFNRSGDTDGITSLGKEYYKPILKQLSDRFSNSKYWYGDKWSIIDMYLFWNYTTAQSGGLDLNPYPSILRHSEAVQERPSVKKVIEQELLDLAKIHKGQP